MARISVKKLHALASGAFVGQGFNAGLASDVAEEFVVAEYAGVRTHGVGKIPSLNLGNLAGSPEISQRGALFVVDGNGTSGLVLMRDIAGRLVDACADHGVALAAVRNFSRYSSLYPYTEMLAYAGRVGILMNSAGPAAVAPFGATCPIAGTNPISFSFPVGGGVQTFDFATADAVWGEIRQAALEGRGVEHGSFYDSAGELTTVPADVRAVRSFGGAKGFALNLAIEILAGPLVGAKAGLRVESEFDCGAVMLAIDPVVLGTDKNLGEFIANLLADVRSARPEAGLEVRTPGDRGRSKIRLEQIADNELEVADISIKLLERMAAGEGVTELQTNPLFN